MIVSADRRFTTRSRRRGRRLVLAASLVTVAALGAWLLLWSGLLAVHRISVEGVSRLTPREVTAAADLRRGEPMITVDTRAVERRVARLGPVASVRVLRSWPSTLRIEVTERQPVAVLVPPDGGPDRLVDRTGVAFATVAPRPALLTPVQTAAPVPGGGEAAVRAAVRVLTTLPPGVRRDVTAVSAPSPAGITLQLSGGRQVVWGDDSRTARKAAVLAALLAAPVPPGGHRPTVYDVSTPDVAVTR